MKIIAIQNTRDKFHTHEGDNHNAKRYFEEQNHSLERLCAVRVRLPERTEVCRNNVDGILEMGQLFVHEVRDPI